MWIAPLVALLMFGLLLLQFRDVTEALIVLVSVPFALVGSFWTLFLLHYPCPRPSGSACCRRSAWPCRPVW